MEPDFARVTQYLPNLPKARLDDRTFDELVEECLLRIPRYCPEWTNHNPGDPGVTLIELFAWLVHQMLYRFNQVPLRHYVAFLELLGIRLQPPASASTELTFYLTKAQSTVKPIPAGTEVATVRTESQEAEVFTTNEDIVVGQAQLKHLLFGSVDSHQPDSDRFPTSFERAIEIQDLVDSNNEESNNVDVDLFTPCEPGKCFYLVVEPTQVSRPAQTEENSSNGNAPGLVNTIEGNVLAFKFKGPAAVTTGINPNKPPLKWEAWDGHQWRDGILREQATDDHTKGFSFDRLGPASPNPEAEGADVILHLPISWPRRATGISETGYEGHWIRCSYITPNEDNQQFGYERSPQIKDISLRTIGVVGQASECIQVERELLGVSNGKAGQTFELASKPILARKDTEHIQICLPGREDAPQDWTEVSDFGESTVRDRHYLIDNSSGTVQFGPLIREPEQLQQQTRDRSQLQSWGRPERIRQTVTLATPEPSIPAILEDTDRYAKKQYGKVPPMGAEIYMTGYRVGGGSQGNVKKEKLTVLKSSIPYIKQVTNYKPATGGLEKESLNDAIIRVPALLRTRKTALTPEDFERTAQTFREEKAVHRAHCITTPHLTTPGVVRLLIVPTLSSKLSRDLSDRGLHPDAIALAPDFKEDLDKHLKLHKALGIRVTTEAPECIGIQVRAEIYLQPQHRQIAEREDDQNRISHQLSALLYQYLNPITGGQLSPMPKGDSCPGWPLGRAVQVSDIVALLQGSPEVQSVGQVQLFKWQQYRSQRGEVDWMRLPDPFTKIDLGEMTIATSWSNADSREPDRQSANIVGTPHSGHELFFREL